MERNILDSEGGVISGDPTVPPEHRPGPQTWDYDPPTPSAILRNSLKLFTEEEFARALGITTQTLVAWRGNGEGPAYAKLGRKVYYPYSAVLEWIGANWQSPVPAPRKRHTVQAATGPVQIDLEDAIAAKLYNSERANDAE